MSEDLPTIMLSETNSDIGMLISNGVKLQNLSTPQKLAIIE